MTRSATASMRTGVVRTSIFLRPVDSRSTWSADAEVTNDPEALGTGEEGVIDGDPVAEKNAFSVPERKLERWAIAGVCHEGHVAAILYAVEKLFRQRSKDDH